MLHARMRLTHACTQGDPSVNITFDLATVLVAGAALAVGCRVYWWMAPAAGTANASATTKGERLVGRDRCSGGRRHDRCLPYRRNQVRRVPLGWSGPRPDGHPHRQRAVSPCLSPVEPSGTATGPSSRCRRRFAAARTHLEGVRGLLGQAAWANVTRAAELGAQSDLLNFNYENPGGGGFSRSQRRTASASC
jgi:hypothetical protein